MKCTVCYFMPQHSEHHSIHIVNLVYETEHKMTKALQTKGLYRVHYVYSGTGVLHLQNKQINVKKGDLFFTFPDTVFYIEPESSDFTYMYISYIGSRAGIIMDKTGINSGNYLINDCEKTEKMWEEAVSSPSHVSGLMAESVLLYTFSHLSERLNKNENDTKNESKLPDLVKKYLDDNFADKKISLELLGSEFSYSPKYISSTFKKHFGIGIFDYLTTVRIHYACNLMSRGHTVISDIANQCGYSDVLYFSKVFKQKYGMSAKDFIKTKNSSFYGTSETF